MNTNVLGKSFIDKENLPYTYNTNLAPNQKFPRKSVCEKTKRVDAPMKTLDGIEKGKSRKTLRSKDGLGRSTFSLILESSLLYPRANVPKLGRDRAVSIQEYRENRERSWLDVINRDKKQSKRHSEHETNTVSGDYVSNYKRVETSKLVNAYGEEIFESLKEKQIDFPKNCLQNHSIPSNLRARMVDWMIEVLSSYKCQHQTFFVAISLMDRFFARSPKSHPVSDLHLTGVTCMFLACKYEEIYPMKLQVVYEKIAHKKLPIDAIKSKEQEILSALDFNIITGSIIEILALAYSKLEFEDPNHKKKEYLEKICIYLSKMVMHDYELLNEFEPLQLASGVLYIGFKILEQVNKGFYIKEKVLITIIIDQ